MLPVKDSQASILTPFLRYLGTFPDVDRVANSLMRGPLAQYSARACDLWAESDANELIRLGRAGPYEDRDRLYQRISISFQSPITESVISGKPVIIRLSKVVELYPAMALDNDYWTSLIEEFGDGDLAHAPIIADGAPIGVFTFVCNEFHDWDPENIARLELLGAALALWMTHPSSHALDLAANNGTVGLSLSPRQVEILELVRQGRSNGAISAHLGYSQSTIKQELLRITRRLRVSTRQDAVTRATELNLMPPPNS